MKLGILTASRCDNNGTILQAVAMQELFSLCSDSVSLINYCCSSLEEDQKFVNNFTVKKLINYPIKLFRHYDYKKFKKKNCKLTNKINSLNEIVDDYDCIIVGSDQVWNLNITKDVNFFLPFVFENKYSYAVSMGSCELEKWNEQYHILSYLSSFKNISVREESSASRLNDNGVISRIDLDPLLMHDDSFWSNLIETPKQIKGKYIFVYLVEENKKAIEYAKNISAKKGVTVVVYSNSFRNVEGCKMMRFTGVSDWLNTVKNAEFVITNSYHCLSMCIVFKKKFSLQLLVEHRNNNSRMLDLINRFGIEIVVNYLENIDNMLINWTNVEENLLNARKKSLDYVENIIASCS